MKAHTFVGVIDIFTGRSMLQHGTKLFLVDHNALSEELFYQLGLRQFSNLGKLNLKPAPKVRELLEIAIENEPGAEENGLDPRKIINVSVPKPRHQMCLWADAILFRPSMIGSWNGQKC